MAGPVQLCRHLLVVVALSRAACAQTTTAIAPDPAAPVASPKLAKLFGGDPPKFDPPKTATPAPTKLNADKPQNGIIRLPTYLVREPRPIRSEDVMTDQARSDALVKRYVGEPTGLDVMLNKYTLNSLWKKIPVLGSRSNFGWAQKSSEGGGLTAVYASTSYADRIALDYSRIEAKRKYLEALGVSADVPPTKPEPATKKESGPANEK